VSQGWKDSENGTAQFVMPVRAGIHFCINEWVPACAESTPQNAPRIEKTCSGVLD